MEKFCQNVRLPQKGFIGWLTTKLFERKNRFLEVNAVKLCELKPDYQVLELGFGPGLGLEAAVKEMDDGPGKLWGLDLSPYMLEVAGNRLQDDINSGKVELCLGTVMDLPFEANTFDRVFHCNCFYFWPDIDKGAQEIIRVMKPDSLMVTTINQASVKKAIERGILKYANPNVTLYMEILDRNGFTDVHMKELDDCGTAYQAIFASVGKKRQLIKSNKTNISHISFNKIDMLCLFDLLIIVSKILTNFCNSECKINKKIQKSCCLGLSLRVSRKPEK